MMLSKTDLDLIKAALVEDLAGGVDITSVATIDVKATAKADFTARNDSNAKVSLALMADLISSMICVDKLI